MKITEAIEKISEKNGKIYRDDWRYYLTFSREGYLILYDHSGELTPYVISCWDFNYDWKIKEY